MARRAAALSPTYAYAHMAPGFAAKANGFFAEARVALETTVRLAPDYEFARTELEEVKRIQQYPMSGSWAFEGIRGWLQIDVDGRALRCRITRSGIARETGALAGSVVTWTTPAADGSVTKISDTVSVAGAELRLKTEQGEFLLRRTAGLPAACEPIFD